MDKREHDRVVNFHGDRAVSLSEGHGIDVASQRMDDLDRECLAFALQTLPGSRRGMDLGCGSGAQGFRLAALGYEVTLVDIIDHTDFCAEVNRTLFQGRLYPICCDIRKMSKESLPGDITILYSQRFLHYLPYEEAVRVVKTLAARMLGDGRAFLSVGGINSELGEGYLEKDKSVRDRFGCLSAKMAEKHLVYAPLCLFSEEEFAEFGRQAGLRPQKVWSSPFGNVKGIFLPGN